MIQYFRFSRNRKGCQRNQLIWENAGFTGFDVKNNVQSEITPPLKWNEKTSQIKTLVKRLHVVLELNLNLVFSLKKWLHINFEYQLYFSFVQHEVGKCRLAEKYQGDYSRRWISVERCKRWYFTWVFLIITFSPIFFWDILKIFKDLFSVYIRQLLV